MSFSDTDLCAKSLFKTDPRCLSHRICYIHSHKFHAHIFCWIRLEASFSRNRRSVFIKKFKNLLGILIKTTIISFKIEYFI